METTFVSGSQVGSCASATASAEAWLSTKSSAASSIADSVSRSPAWAAKAGCSHNKNSTLRRSKIVLRWRSASRLPPPLPRAARGDGARRSCYAYAQE